MEYREQREKTERSRMRETEMKTERERETRGTKGMWSSPTLCLAAL